MTNKSESFKDFIVLDVLDKIPGIRARGMFGGYGLYGEGTIFALIIGSSLFFKVNGATKEKYEKMGSHPFTYTHKDGKEVSVSYWLVPEELFDDPQKVVELALEAIDARKEEKSLKSKSKKK